MAVVRHLVSRRVIDIETILGAIAAYLLIGMFFAFAYHLVGTVQDGPFFGADGDGDLSQDLFFSFTTMLTIGFGNLVPAGNPGQTMAVAEGLTGQLFLVVAVAKAVSSWRPAPGRATAATPAPAARRGRRPPTRSLRPAAGDDAGRSSSALPGEAHPERQHDLRGRRHDLGRSDQVADRTKDAEDVLGRGPRRAGRGRLSRVGGGGRIEGDQSAEPGEGPFTPAERPVPASEPELLRENIRLGGDGTGERFVRTVPLT